MNVSLLSPIRTKLFFLLLIPLVDVPISMAQIDREAVVHVEAECRDPSTWAITNPEGSGVVFHKDGFILTAAHVVSCKFNQKQGDGTVKQVQHDLQAVRVRLGTHVGAQVDAVIRETDESEDIAVLKIVGAPREYGHFVVCGLAPLELESPFVGYGYPEGMELAPVPGLVGDETPKGHYAVVAAFVGGMSGGPVLMDGRVTALIKGGAGDVQARRQIVPLFRVGSMIEDVTGGRFPFCDEMDSFSVEIDALIEEISNQTRINKSQRYGVSTGSLIEQVCQPFAVPSTEGWTIRRDSVEIVDRIQGGSSRSAIVDITDQQVTVEFCARSVLDGFDKVTGDSFGSVQFVETKTIVDQLNETIEASSENGTILLQLPKNTVSWTGRLSGWDSVSTELFSGPGSVGSYQISVLNSDTISVNRTD